MPTSDILTELQTVNASITGVLTAPTTFPAALRASELPMALSYPEIASYDLQAREVMREARTWYIRLYVLPIGHGQGVDEGFTKTVAFVDRFREEWIKVANQQAGTWWSELQIVSDSGVRSDMRLHNSGETLYWGIELELLVIRFEDENVSYLVDHEGDYITDSAGDYILVHA